MLTFADESTYRKFMNTIFPFARPLYIMAKPAGAACNLRCRYCYYLEKSKLYPGSGSIMDDSILEKFIKDYLESQTSPEVLFTWHGGEPLLRNLEFYKKVMKLQRKYAKGRVVDNCLQTNGTMISDDFAKFFHDNGWLIGVSIDGPEEYHDAYRRTAAGGPSFAKVMKGINTLNRHGAEWNAMAVVNNLNGDHPKEFYSFFKEAGCKFIQFSPIVDSYELGKLTEYSVKPQQWGHFLCGIFDEWVRTDVGTIFVQIFDATLANWAGVAPGVCSMAKHCGQAGVIEHNGDIYSCDHFVYPQYKLGNIKTDTLTSMMYSPRQVKFGRDKYDTLPSQCLKCKWLFACNGECPKNRFCKTRDGEDGLNYLCEGFQMFFGHVEPYMNYMKRKLDIEEAPADIMEAISNGTL